MWMTSIADDKRLQSVVFFLSDALRSVLADGEALRESRCAPPDIGPESDCDEILMRLDAFRANLQNMRGREAIMVAKLTQARAWAQALKKLEPELRPEIGVFLLATVFCEDLQQAMLPDPQRAFHGGGVARRFLGERRPGAAMDAGETVSAGSPASIAYIIAGKVRIEDLLAACENFLGVIDSRYSRDDAPEIDARDAQADEPLDLAELIEEAEASKHPHEAAEQPAQEPAAPPQQIAAAAP